MSLDDVMGFGSATEAPVVQEEVPIFKREMLKTIEDVEEYSWKRGEMGGLDWGWEQLNKATEGLNTGVHLVAGQSNIGKSSMCLQMAYNIAKYNQEPTKEKPKKAYCLYFSLDDSANELVPRMVAIDQSIPINVVRFPKKYQEHIQYMERRHVGLENVRRLTDHFGLVDVNSGGSDIEYIEETAKKYALDLAKVDENYQLVLFIDNFHDITVRDIKFGSDGNAKYDYLADQLSRIATTMDCPIICTAEFRKLNGNRRPRLDDIRETVKIIYEAKAIFLCYNEVGLRGQQSDIYWQRPDSPDKQPIYEMHIGKNKFGSFKGRLFFEMFPEMGIMKEVPEAGNLRYNQMISG